MSSHALRAVAVATLALSISACANDPAAPGRSTDGGDRAGRVQARCAEALRDEEPTDCEIGRREVRLRACTNPGPGGSSVRVAGISCESVRKNRLLILLARHFDSYDRRQSSVYRPSIGDPGSLGPLPILGWTCWAGFIPDTGPGIQHVCWRRSDLLLFNFS